MNEIRSPGSQQPEILIVEDSPTQAQRLRYFLERAGYHVTSAANGRQAMEALRQRTPALIISDVHMPEMDGYELCRRVKGDVALAGLPVILVTNMSDPQHVLRSLECRADNFILKPYVADYLLNRVQSMLFNRDIQRPAQEDAGEGVEIFFGGARHIITAGRAQILNLLLSSYDAADQRNKELSSAQEELQEINQSLGVANRRLEQQIREREQAEARIAQLNETLEQRVRERTGELEQASLMIRTLNAELEQRVKDRTRQLEEANKELESFSYSVSHDLRAPLRHIEGYAQMLAKAIEGQLSDKARRYLKTISESSLEMGRLIDNLLAFSRMGRAEMRETPVVFDALMKEALRSLEMETRDRHITWEIAPVPDVLGDSPMLRQVLANLIGNAVKYSRQRDPARIEIGCIGEEDGRIIFFVRDNGAGFDMQYAHKLFGVFQRLHRAEEFEGTGVGLATVQRIIARHGGRVWAESKLGEGATFYFTLKPAVAA